jgi:hypothetical protein
MNPAWPDTNLASDQREGDGVESFEVIFSSNEGDYTYITTDPSEFNQFTPGSKWTLNVNALGGLVSVDPAN